ncbi:MAG TPA: hypothetical protein VFJ43_13460, partial [Bacteroidia bacterium]|nr:hypothetical protein [Bacteroidia bacterium]
MTRETILRFFNVRPAAPIKLSGEKKVLVDPYSLSGNKTGFFKELEKASGQNSPHEKILSTTQRFMTTPLFITRPSNGKTDLRDLINWFNENRRMSAVWALSSSEFNSFTGGALSGSKIPPDISEISDNLADSVTALAISGKSEKRKSQDLTLALKLLYLRYAITPNPAKEESFVALVDRLVISLPPFLTDALDAEISSGKGDNSNQRKPGEKNSSTYADDLEKTHREISALLSLVEPEREAIIDIPVPKTTTRNETTDEGITPSRQSEISGGLRLPASSIAGLSVTAKTILSRLKIDVTRENPFTIIARIEDELNTLPSSAATNGIMHIGGITIDLAKLRASFVPFSGTITSTSEANKCTFSAGIGDLLLVKQRLKEYRLGEIAHVENIMQGEQRGRNHRRLNRVTDETFTETEHEETKESDLETTDRNELQTEMTRTATTELGLDVGVQVSGSFGPSISFDSQVDSSFSSSVEESQRKATNFSRDVTEKSSEIIRDKVKKSRTTIKVEEIEEINDHKFENTGDENRNGIYRWLDKIYEAQVFSYGQRMIFDLVLPEPAAFYLFALIESPPEGTTIPKPEAPTYQGHPLSPQDLTRSNYTTFVRTYQVTGAPEPPPQFITVSFFDKQEGSSKADYARSGKIEVPDNYAAFAAAIGSDIAVPAKGDHSAHILVGSRIADMSDFSGWKYFLFGSLRREKELSIALNYHRVINFTAAIDVFCELSTTGFRAWQNKVYEAIIEAYQNQLSAFEEAVANAGVQRGAAFVLGADPGANEIVTREELRKLSLMLLTDNAEPGLDSYLAQAEPLPDPDKACSNGAIVRFFENAFEWNNMAYVLYPYFWGRKARWSSTIQLAGTDNEFTAFLKAGAARVQLAVRPGFEKAVVHFIQFGKIW